MTDSQALNRLRRAPLLIRRFGIVQALRFLLPEFARTTRLSKFLTRYLGGYRERFQARDSTVLWLRPFSMDLGIFHEVWDHQRYTAGSIGAVARRGTVVDIGAHIGLFSIFASRMLQAKRIVSVEPDPENFELLSRNISDNHVESATMIRVAVGGVAGERRIYADSSNTGGHSFYSRGSLSRLVRVVSLVELFKSSSISECSLLKMDCEGAEMEVFENVPDELLGRVSAIALEYHLEAYLPERLEKLKKRMEDLGFILEVRPTSKTLGIIRGIRRS